MKASSRTAAVLLVALVALAQIACAGIRFRRAKDPDTNGIRYYRPATYFLVTPDYEKGQATITLFHGPDTCRLFAAKPYAVLATNTSKLEFSGGMLSTVSTDSDATAIPRAIIQATASLAKSALDAAAKNAKLAALGAALVESPPTVAQQPPIFLFVSSSDGGLSRVFPPDPGVTDECDTRSAVAKPGAANVQSGGAN